MAISKFSFPTAIHFGPGARGLVAEHLAAQGVKRPLIVTDKGLAALPLASEIWLTEIDALFDGDTFMPPFPAEEWRVDSRQDAVDAQSGLAYAFIHLSRIRPAALA